MKTVKYDFLRKLSIPVAAATLWLIMGVGGGGAWHCGTRNTFVARGCCN